MDDTENTESQTNETNESQTDDTTDSQTDDTQTNDTTDSQTTDSQTTDNETNDSQTEDKTEDKTEDDRTSFEQAWVDMHQHTDWGSGLTVDDVFNNDNVDNGYSTGDDSTNETTNETNNQSRTENQGDYDTSSKENSNVQTTTIGKQDEITTSPDTITENKGVISNSNIQSVEELDFQQKDKDDLNSKKDRDKAEAEDKSDQLKNELRNDAEKTAAANKDGKGFQVGNKDKKEKELEDAFNAVKKARENLENEINEANQKKADLDKQREENQKKIDDGKKEIKTVNDILNSKNPLDKINSFLSFRGSKYEQLKEEVSKHSGKDLSKASSSEVLAEYSKQYEEEVGRLEQEQQKIDGQIAENNKRLDDLPKKLNDAKIVEKNINKKLEDYRNEHNTDTIPTNPETPAPEVPEEKPEIKEDTKVVPEELPPEEKPAVPEEKPEEKGQELVDPTNPAQKAKDLADKANNLRNGNYNSEKEREEANDLADSLDNLSASMKNAAEASKNIVDENGKVDLNKCTPEQIETWEKAQEQLSKNLNDALSKSKAYEQHYGNKQFTRDIAKANDFKVPGTDKTYSQLAIDMATKSPQIAQAMYDAKADRYKEKAKQAAEDGHKVSAWWNNTMAKIESMKSNMSQSLIGSKLTFADNKVRNQFNAMADLNMKATYAAYNNRLNHPEDYQPEDLEEARQQIDQAHALQYASAALKASTGALSGLGDSIKDGVYGTTNAKDLSGYQQVLADVGAFSQIVLGMGVSPLANKGYTTFNNLYPGSLFSKDIDKDGFAWTEEYGNNPAAEAILSVAQLSYGVSLLMNPLTWTNGITMINNSIQNGLNAAYGVRNDARKLINLTNDITSYFEDVKEKEGIPPEAIPEIDNAIKEITTKTEDFKINSSEINNFDNWLEGSGSNTADNGKFNQKLSYEDWLKLIQADPAMQEYAKKLAAEKNKNAQEDNADSRVNS